MANHGEVWAEIHKCSSLHAVRYAKGKRSTVAMTISLTTVTKWQSITCISVTWCGKRQKEEYVDVIVHLSRLLRIISAPTSKITCSSIMRLCSTRV